MRNNFQHVLKTHNYFEKYPLVLQCWKVFQNLAISLHDIKLDQEIMMLYLIMVKKQRRKKGWKTMFGIAIDRGKSLKLEDEFFQVGEFDASGVLRYT